MFDRNRTKIGLAAIAAGSLLAVTSAASADVIFSFGFTDLDGDFNAGTSMFRAKSIDNFRASTGGDVSRQALPPGTAEFDTGFEGGDGPENYSMHMRLSNITSTSADVLLGDSSFEIVDADGDTITGDIVGRWEAGNNGFMFFNGDLVNVVLTDNGQQDGTFDGPSGGDFSMNFGGSNGPFEGAIVTLGMNGDGNFFLDDFQNFATQIGADVIPAPAGLALLGVGGIFASRRRRRA